MVNTVEIFNFELKKIQSSLSRRKKFEKTWFSLCTTTQLSCLYREPKLKCMQDEILKGELNESGFHLTKLR